MIGDLTRRTKIQPNVRLTHVKRPIYDLLANFRTTIAQAPRAYAWQMSEDHPELSASEAAADAVAAVHEFHTAVVG
jgi:hypothetical protein